jgi:hypothetical protein
VFKSAIYYFSSGASYLLLKKCFFLRGGVKNCCFTAMLLDAILNHMWTLLFSPFWSKLTLLNWSWLKEMLLNFLSRLWLESRNYLFLKRRPLAQLYK